MLTNEMTNVILITVDSLRADRLGCYGYERPVSRNIDRFASNCHLFTDAYSNGPNTPHAFPAIMASRNALLSSKLSLFDAPVTLAESLKEAGYKTIGFNAANPYVSKHFGYDRGFSEFHDYIDFNSSPSTVDQRSADSLISIPGLDVERYLITRENMRAKAQLEQQFIADVFSSLNSVEDNPFFLWLHFMDTHYPYLPQAEPQNQLNECIVTAEENFTLNSAVRGNLALPPEKLREVNLLYDACVLQLDEKIGQLLRYLETRNLFDNALIIFCADHGEEFLDHGDLQHKSKLFNELIRVPLLLKLAGQRQGKIHTDPVSLLGVAPTILEKLGLQNAFENDGFFLQSNRAPDHPVFACASIGPDGGTPVEQNLFITDRMPKVYAHINKRYKLVLNTSDCSEFLFDLQQDPEEKVNLCHSETNHLQVMEKELVKQICLMEEARIMRSAERNIHEFIAK